MAESAPDDTRTSLTHGRRSVRINSESPQVIDISEKHGPLYNAIPCMPMSLAVVCCLLNIFIPGSGTMVSAFSVLCGSPTRISKPAKAVCLNLLAAFLQMVTFFVIVGWIWSILWGMNFVQIAMSDSKTVRAPYYVRRQSSVEQYNCDKK